MRRSVAIALIAFMLGSGTAAFAADDKGLPALWAALEREISARISGDAATLAAARAYTDASSSAAALAAEAAARAAADAALQNNIDAEAAARQAADTTLQSNVNNAVTAAQQYTNSKLTSPNGLFSISVTNAGILLTGPSGHVSVGVGRVELNAAGNRVTVTPSAVAIVGTVVTLNGACHRVARVGDLASFVPFGGGQPIIIEGSPTVLSC